MLRKLFVASMIVAASSSVALAGHMNYKGEYKGEVPCPTYMYTTGPYLGFSLGVRDNYSSAPAFYKGLEGTLSAGYSTLVNPLFYLAGEIFLNGNAQLSNYPNPVGGSIRSTWGYGLSILPGYMLTDRLVGYLRLGVVRNRFNSQGVWRTGGQAGIGLQAALTPNWDIRSEYDYSVYRNIGGLGTPRSDQYSLGLVYKFI